MSRPMPRMKYFPDRHLHAGPRATSQLVNPTDSVNRSVISAPGSQLTQEERREAQQYHHHHVPHLPDDQYQIDAALWDLGGLIEHATASQPYLSVRGPPVVSKETLVRNGYVSHCGESLVEDEYDNYDEESLADRRVSVPYEESNEILNFPKNCQIINEPRSEEELTATFYRREGGPLLKSTQSISLSKVPRERFVYRQLSDTIDYVLFSTPQSTAHRANLPTIMGILLPQPGKIKFQWKHHRDGRPVIGPSGKHLKHIPFLPDLISYEEVTSRDADWQVAIIKAFGMELHHIVDRVPVPETIYAEGEAAVDHFYNTQLLRRLANGAVRIRSKVGGMGPVSRRRKHADGTLQGPPLQDMNIVGRHLNGLNLLYNVVWPIHFDTASNIWYMHQPGSPPHIRHLLPRPSEVPVRVLETLEAIGWNRKVLPKLEHLGRLQQLFVTLIRPDGTTDMDCTDFYQPPRHQKKRPQRQRATADMRKEVKKQMERMSADMLDVVVDDEEQIRSVGSEGAELVEDDVEQTGSVSGVEAQLAEEEEEFEDGDISEDEMEVDREYERDEEWFPRG